MKDKLTLLLRLIAAGIFGQTLFFKFTGAAESVYIFSTLGIEPWGRWLSGILELIVSILLLVPATQGLGALVGLGVISGAILSHVFVLGLVVQNDGGLLFALACIVFLCCLLILIFQRDRLLAQLKHLRSVFRSDCE
jgi:uncharacterized membrane protein